MKVSLWGEHFYITHTEKEIHSTAVKQDHSYHTHPYPQTQKNNNLNK